MIRKVKTILRDWWDREWNFSRPYERLYLLIIAVGVVYTFLEIFLKFGNPGVKFGIEDIIPFLRDQISYNAPDLVKRYFPYVWAIVALSCYSFRVYMIIASYFSSMKAFNPQNFQRDLVVYLSAGLMALASVFLLFRLIGFIFWLSGHDYMTGVHLVQIFIEKCRLFVNAYVPTIVNLPYPVALLSILMGLTLSSLSGYLVHWLTHQSRFLWLTTHRPHHLPEMLHPLGAPLAFNFDFLLVIPSLIFNVLFTKLFYADSLILETTIILIFYYHFEIYNHMATHYDISFRNKLVRFFCDITGSGIYHYMHHTSEEGKDAVNLGGGMFLIWDRIFGTYAQPPAIKPNTGLTNNPTVIMNPFRVNFSGFAQLWYELKHNRDFKTRWRIIFGSIWYIPPHTKEYLITGYPSKKKNPA